MLRRIKYALVLLFSRKYLLTTYNEKKDVTKSRGNFTAKELTTSGNAIYIHRGTSE